MQTFLAKVLDDLLDQRPDLSGTTFVLPNKRSGTFLRKLMRDKLPVNTFLPVVKSIDELMEDISGFIILDQISMIFEFYSAYGSACPTGKKEAFESFFKWAKVLLQDFNELDANLKDVVGVFSYVSDTRRLEQWSPEDPDLTPMVENYLEFHRNIVIYYKSLIKLLEEKKVGYQGLVYRKATERIEEFSATLFPGSIVFAGFNALGEAEEFLVRSLAEQGTALVYWDNDEFYQKSNSSAGIFFKKYLQTWPIYQRQSFNWTSDLINTEKNIHLLGLPKQISQIKEVGNLLARTEASELEDTAVVLGNERLLPSLLQSLPKNIERVNITMGYDLHNSSIYKFLEALYQLQINSLNRPEKESVYYRDLESLFHSPVIKAVLRTDHEFARRWQRSLLKEKTVYFDVLQILGLAEGSKKLQSLFSKLFTGWEGSADQVIENTLGLLQELRKLGKSDPLKEEILFRHYQIFEQLKHLNRRYEHMGSVEEVFQFFRILLRNEQLSFQGEPLSGLQIMGLLESRTLDFKNVIITSVNEGFLPASGGQNSFIPLDIKREYGLPTPAEKDAIFTYHFFRLLHRAENVFLLFNNITDDFGSGEPSRFISQLEVARALGYLGRINIQKKNLAPKLKNDPIQLQLMPKSEPILSKIIETGAKGFSPSSLAMYIRNPLDFYKRKVLGIKEYQEMEEHMAHNTFGTVVHDTLESLYMPHLNKILTESDIQSMKKLYRQETQKQFKNSYSPVGKIRGKNYLSLEIARQFVLNFLNYELGLLRKGKKIRILGLEKELTRTLDPADFPHPVVIRGKIDRIDEIDGILRIVDYKTGKVGNSELQLKDWGELIADYKYSKAFQVLTYAWMFHNEHKQMLEDKEFESGVISFKNLGEGFLKFNKGAMALSDLENYKEKLLELLQEIYDPDKHFEEKEIPEYNF